MSGSIRSLPRREFLRYGLAAGGGLTLGLYLPAYAASAAVTEAAPFAPNAFVRIGTDDTVTVIVKHVELGQGTYTGLPTLVAEELDADWSQVRAAGAPADPTRYNNLNWGPVQGTGGSSSMNNAYLQMRRAGAAARFMLIGAAAATWGVPAAEITVTRGVLRHAPSGRSARFGALAAAAASQPVPADPPLKQAADFVYIGKHVPRIDMPEKVHGTAVYTLDYARPGLVTALVAHAPRFGAVWNSYRDAEAKQVDGVEAVVPITSGVAVVARSFWAAKQGRDRLTIEWDESSAVRLSSAAILDHYRELARTPGLTARRDGDCAKAFAGAHRVIEAAYEFPYLAHASMEPMNCVAEFTGDGCELWYGAQSLTYDQHNVGRALGIAPERVVIHTLYAGGSFGRRADSHADYVVEAARIAKALGPHRPVKLVWTREDDMRAGAYRPLNFHALRGALNAKGDIVAWQHRVVGQSLRRQNASSAPTLDRSCVEGAADLPYAIPNLEVEAHQPVLGIPVLWWRSVGHTHTAFSTESFLDELAHAAGKDPLALRLALLAPDDRRRAALELAAAKSGWGTPLATGRGRGIAVHQSFKSYVAEVAEVTAAADGGFTVDRVVIAVDCGLAVNPDIVRAQMEGGMGYGLSAALTGAITLDDGRVVEDNFDTYPVLRMSQMPEVEVHIVPSTAAPTGVGEPGVPPIAPAVANALFAATGKRHRNLPLIAPKRA